jgi:hypothetical protein
MARVYPLTVAPRRTSITVSSLFAGAGREVYTTADYHHVGKV